MRSSGHVGGTTPDLRQDMMYPGLRPSSDAPVSAASFHCASRSGQSGLPSSSTRVARRSSAEIVMFHIAHAVVVNQKIRSPGRASIRSPNSLRCSSRMPPWPCTIAFGRPVVPEENSTYSGWSNATRSNSGAAGSDRSSAQDSASGTGWSP